MSRRKPICNAPFANIYIDSIGNVTPCCFNRDDVMGNIYSDDLETIWNGKTSLRIRKQLLQHEFPNGCHLCKKMLEQGNYYNSGIFTYQKLNYKSVEIQAIDFELSYFCNLSCIMCNLHAKDYQLTPEKETLLLNKLKPLIPNLKKTRFYGGEPFIIPIYHKIWKNIIKANPACNILLQTNGMHLDEAFKTFARQGNFTINVSLDSLNAENLSKIRKGSDLSLIIQNLKHFKKITKNPVSLTITPMRMNWEEIPDLVRFANKNGYQIFFNTMIQPQSLSLWSLPSNDIFKIQQLFSMKHIFICSARNMYNYLKYKGLKHYIHQLYVESLKRPTYTKDEVNQAVEEIILFVQEKLPKLNLNETAAKQYLSDYLQFHKKEEVMHYISSISVEEFKIKLQKLFVTDN